MLTADYLQAVNPDLDVESHFEAYEMNTSITSIVDQVLPFLKRYGVTKAGIFGSFARQEATGVSDLDLVVELPPGSSLLDLVGLEQDLSDQLEIVVDVHTYRSLHPRLRERILAEEVEIL